MKLLLLLVEVMVQCLFYLTYLLPLISLIMIICFVYSINMLEFEVLL